MPDWYRRKTWTEQDQKEFFLKLGRAREYNRAQYLYIQAVELIETKKSDLLRAAEELLRKILLEYPDEKIHKSQTLNSLGEIYLTREDFVEAINHFQMAIDFEKEFPNVVSSAKLNYSELVIRANKTELYPKVEEMLLNELNRGEQIFPSKSYLIYSILSVIADFKGDKENADIYSELADTNVKTKTNSLNNPRKRSLGIVKKRIDWLDKLVKRIQ